jgi:amidase
MGFVEYDKYDALGLAQLVKRGEVHPSELVEETIARIEAVNPTLNAVVVPMFEEARRVAKGPLPAAQLSGVPFLLKDLRSAYKGFPMRAGSRLLRDYVPNYDGELVRRYKAAGLVIAGKTSTPEFGILPVTEPDLHGPTRNPWDPSRTSGGSSGGAAASVAAGIVPVAQGGDGGGSIRIPASCCGVFGLKPSRGRIPVGPEDSELFFGFAIEHVLSRTVRDSAAMLDATHGAELTSLYHAREPERPFLDEVRRDPGKLRIAFTTRPFLPAKAHPDCVSACQEAAQLCASLGHEVDEASPGFDGHVFARSFFLMFCVAAATELVMLERLVGRPVKAGDVEPGTWACAMIGRKTSAADFAVALRKLRECQRAITRFHGMYDLLLTPSLAKPPLPIGALRHPAQEAVLDAVGRQRALQWVLGVPGLIDVVVDRAYAFTPFSPLANVTGQPSMSLPFSWNADGLPIGVMFTGRLGDEAMLFRIAAQIEAARPWAHLRPRVHAGRS